MSTCSLVSFRARSCAAALIVLSAFARMAEQAPFYIFTAFVFAYGVGTLKVTRDFLLVAVLVASVVSFFSIPFFGHLSDLIGRKKMYRIGAISCGRPRSCNNGCSRILKSRSSGTPSSTR